jgi:cell division septation protein DedD
MTVLQQLIVKQKLPIQLGEWAYLEAHYEPASLQQGGRVIKPPRYRWFLYEGICESTDKLTIDLSDEVFKAQLLAGMGLNESFECPSLGMFYKREGRFELLLSKGTAYQAGPNYGLPSLNLQLVKSNPITQTPAKAQKKQVKNLWWLQVAATVLFIVLLNVLALNYLSENGGLSFKQAAKVSLFDSLKEPDPFRYSEETLEEMVDTSELKLDQAPSVADTIKKEVSLISNEADHEKMPVVVSRTNDLVQLEQKNAVSPTNNEKSHTRSTGAEMNLKVVVGAFGLESNALKFVSELQKRGFNSQVLQPEKGSLYRVFVLPTSNSVSQEDFLKLVQENIHPQAWVLAE